MQATASWSGMVQKPPMKDAKLGTVGEICEWVSYGKHHIPKLENVWKCDKPCSEVDVLSSLGQFCLEPHKFWEFLQAMPAFPWLMTWHQIGCHELLGVSGGLQLRSQMALTSNSSKQNPKESHRDLIWRWCFTSVSRTWCHRVCSNSSNTACPIFHHLPMRPMLLKVSERHGAWTPSFFTHLWQRSERR